MVRFLMGDANMGMFAVEEWCCNWGLTVNLLAWHCEYPNSEDYDRSLRDGLIASDQVGDKGLFKFDSNGIWAVGPIGRIRHQGPARHALCASTWPQNVVAGGTRCGEFAGSFRRLKPSAWPEVNQSLLAWCGEFKDYISHEDVTEHGVRMWVLWKMIGNVISLGSHQTTL